MFDVQDVPKNGTFAILGGFTKFFNFRQNNPIECFSMRGMDCVFTGIENASLIMYWPIFASIDTPFP